MKIVLLGPPGAGKGTQSKSVAAALKVPHISTGDLLRKNVAESTAVGREAKNYMDKGLLVPDELVTAMLEERLKAQDARSGFILDGFPRTVNQAKTLDSILERLSMNLDIVIDLDSSEKVIVQRLSGRLVCRKCGANYHRTNMPPKQDGVCDLCGGELYQRQDDREETIKQRLRVYRQEVAALLDHYKRSSLLRQVNADGDAGDVLRAVMDLIAGSPKKS